MNRSIKQIEIESSLAESAKLNDLIYLGAVDLKEEKTFPAFEAWLKDSKHADMSYLEKYLNIRKDPREIFPGAKSAFVFAFLYGSKESFSNPSKPMVAQYARMSDYHKFFKLKIEAVVKKTVAEFQLSANGRAFVDAAPILERALTADLPQVFIGKNTCTIHKEIGSFFVIGEWISDISFVVEGKPEQINPSIRGDSGGCGTCKRCQVHCPTGALDEDYVLDARKCISYWTIENRGLIPKEYWKHLSTYVYGCDICQNVCPYNRVKNSSPNLNMVKKYDFPPLYDVVRMTQLEYESFFGGSPMTRAKISGLKRNALIAMYVGSDRSFDEALTFALQSKDKLLFDTAEMILEERSKNGGR